MKSHVQPRATSPAAPPPLMRRLRRGWARIARAGVHRGVPASWVGYRWLPAETVPAYFARRGDVDPVERCEVVHPEAIADNPLPRNVASRAALPGDRGWWGFSFRDVPARTSGITLLATIAGCRVVWYHDAARQNDFYPAIVTGDGRALDLREMRFRPVHAETLRRCRRTVRLARATWILERVYHNHAHWLTAHLPKILLLRERSALADVLLPPELTQAMDGSLRLLGLAPEEFRRFDMSAPLHVDALTILVTDRFRPELLRLVPRAFAPAPHRRPHRRVFISRAHATRRRLRNEDEVWRLLQPAGFERVRFEDLTFDAQVALMQETTVLVGPHGAGLTNMMFCPTGAHVVEVADPGFPNPNFYALASALGHAYWLLPAAASGDCHPLEKDLHADAGALRNILPWIAPA